MYACCVNFNWILTFFSNFIVKRSISYVMNWMPYKNHLTLIWCCIWIYLLKINKTLSVSFIHSLIIQVPVFLLKKKSTLLLINDKQKHFFCILCITKSDEKLFAIFLVLVSFFILWNFSVKDKMSSFVVFFFVE